MSKNEFDELLLKKLQEEDLAYDPEHWDRLSQLLPPSLAPAANKGRKWLIATGIAAAAAFVLATVFYVKLMDKSNDAFPVQEPSVAQKPTETVPAPATGTNVTPPSVQERQNMPVPAPSNPAPAPVTANNSSSANPYTTRAPYNPAQVIPVPVPGTTTREEEHKEEKMAQEPPREQQIVPQSPMPRQKESPVVAKKEENQASVPTYFNDFDNDGPATYVSGAAKANRTSLSLGGGVNYGNLNTGYTVGVSARTKIAGNFFVDGTVAMMYNNNANNVANYNGSTTAKALARPSGQLAASPAIEPTQNLYYVQVNPSIGYQIDKNVALSVGSDFQQMLSRTDGSEKVQLAADNTKIFPAFDVGLTTKSEFNITPNIQAGLMYREGLSNLLKNDGNKYVNRRYFQVQFKYNIPVN